MERLDYTVRRSARARYARLVVSPRDGLVVVVPRRFDLRRVPELVESRADWAERTLRRIADERASVESDGCAGASVIALRAIGEQWRVERVATASAGVRVAPTAGAVLIARGAVEDAAAFEAALRRWLDARARGVLPEWMNALASDHGEVLAGVAIRAQKSRWASCSTARRVSLNRALLFLPESLVEHVLVHELCHLEEMNHSPKFWALLRELDPAAAEHRAALRTAWKYVPSWAHA